MNEQERRYQKQILKLIRKHIGKVDPIQVDQLMECVPLNDREIRRVVQYLVNEGNYPIGSTTKGPYGFYMIASFEDYLEAVKNLMHRKDKLRQRVESLREACNKHGLNVPKVEIRKSNGNPVFNISNSVVIYFK
ncbi:MAG: hypothetical protein ABIE03_01855 [Patescibacteria group bacterium]